MTGEVPNLILAGPTGVGKTSVAASLAGRLGLRLLDFDSEIERRFGMTVAEIFGRHGEPVFRRAEAELCQELVSQRGVVASTGGGAVVPPENRAALDRAGVLICLTCEPAELMRRLRLHGGLGTRPLLRDSPQEALQRMLEQRRLAYESIPLRIDTTRLALPEVVDAVFALYSAASRRFSSGQPDQRP